MNVCPSTSVIVAPDADLINRGVPPTPRKARTGELTPPGINSTALAKSSSERLCSRCDCIIGLYDDWLAMMFSLTTRKDVAAPSSTKSLLYSPNGFFGLDRDRPKARHT